MPPWLRQTEVLGYATSRLLLIRLFQVTTIGSIAACLAQPSRGLFASFSSSLPTKNPASSTWPSAAGPRVSSVRDAPTLAATRWWDGDVGSVPPAAATFRSPREPSFTIPRLP